VFIKTIAIWFFGIALFLTLYVSSTMNAIHDAYYVGIDDFKTPFYLVRLALIVGLIIVTVLSVAVKPYRESGFPFGRSLGMAAIISTLVVWAFGFAPCMHEYALPRSLEKVVAHSLLCPEYSNRSYVWQVIAIIFGTLSYFSANQWKLKRS
jgi:hypothetical protein